MSLQQVVQAPFHPLLFKDLKIAIIKAGGGAQYGRRFGISRSYVCHILARRKAVPQSIIEDLGYEIVIRRKR
jgi:hypothetical protein